MAAPSQKVYFLQKYFCSKNYIKNRINFLEKLTIIY